MSLVLAIVLVLYGLSAWFRYQTNISVFGIGAVAGGIAAFLLRPSIVGWHARTERPERATVALILCLVFGVCGLVVGGLTHLNGALDTSQAELHRGHVTSVGGTGRGRSRMVRVSWESGGTSDIQADRDTREGDQVTQVRHHGALGWTWVEAPAVRRR